MAAAAEDTGACYREWKEQMRPEVFKRLAAIGIPDVKGRF